MSSQKPEKEIKRWAMGFPAGSKSSRELLNRVVFRWYQAVTGNWHQEGCNDSVPELAEAIKKEHRTVQRGLKFWKHKDRRVLLIHEQVHPGTKGPQKHIIELCPEWYRNLPGDLPS